MVCGHGRPMPEIYPEVTGATLSGELKRLQHVIELAVTAVGDGNLEKAQGHLHEVRSCNGKVLRALENLLGDPEKPPRKR